MKTKFYFINSNGERILARESTNDYQYALVDKNKGVVKCSAKLETIQQEFNYRTKGYGYKFDEKVNGKYLYSGQFENPENLTIVKLIKG